MRKKMKIVGISVIKINKNAQYTKKKKIAI